MALSTSPRLSQWIYGEDGPPAQVDAARLAAWDQAFEGWLEGSTSEAVRAMRARAWRAFLQYLGKPPWQATANDLDAWTTAEREAGRSEICLAMRIRHLKGFYDFCITNGCDPAYVGEGNPAREAKKPKTPLYNNLNYLSREEGNALLEAIEEDQSLLGKRDYALFSLLLLSGWKVKDARRLRWGDLEFGEDEMPSVRWPKSPRSPQKMPTMAWSAAYDFLRCSGRLGAMQPDWILYPPLLPGAVLLPLNGEAGEWANTEALTQSYLNRVLKKYARWAGLRAEELRFTTLRNTAVVWMAGAGLSREELCRRLGIAHQSNLRTYLGKLRAYPKADLWSPEGPQEHTTHGQGLYWAHDGICPALKHGVFAGSLPEAWWEELFDDMPVLRYISYLDDPLLWQIGLARLLTRKLLEAGFEAETLKEMIRVTRLAVIQAGRMERAIKRWHRLHHPPPPVGRRSRRQRKKMSKADIQRRLTYLEEAIREHSPGKKP